MKYFYVPMPDVMTGATITIYNCNRLLYLTLSRCCWRCDYKCATVKFFLIKLKPIFVLMERIKWNVAASSLVLLFILFSSVSRCKNSFRMKFIRFVFKKLVAERKRKRKSNKIIGATVGNLLCRQPVYRFKT